MPIATASPSLIPSMSYCQELWMESACGVLGSSKPILKDQALHDLWEIMRSPSPMPSLGGPLRPLAHQRDPRDPGEAAAGLGGSGAHGGTRCCDRRGRAQVAPGLSREIVQGP